MSLRDSAEPVVQTSNPSRPSQQAAAEKLDPEELDVRLEALKQPPPQPDETGRNPFRFKPKAAPVLPPTRPPSDKGVKPGPPVPPTATADAADPAEIHRGHRSAVGR